ncbi:MAG: electron transfer flavoprotein subunit beta/FixA family protein [Acidobacteria bacterium]|nr:electron transfer flavoprotein subunit beta/FixA family protein [Acidobacteriota bacterium]
MKIVVCMKTVADTETRVKPAPDGCSVSQEGVNFIMSPYDEFAVEEALKLREKLGAGEIVIVSAGGPECEKTLRGGLALGVDRAVWVQDPAFARAEPFYTARVLAEVVKAEAADLVLFGKQGVGQDFGQVPALVAELLGLPCANVAVGVEVGDGRLTVHREIDGGEEVVECALPAVVSAQKGLNSPRYASMKGILTAKKKAIETRSAADLGVGAVEGSWSVEKVELPPARPAGRLVPGEPEQQVRDLVQLLRTEAKVL